TNKPDAGQDPYAWLTDAMTLAYLFMVIHETSHQGPQRRGASSYASHLPAACAAAGLFGVELDEVQALAWAKELAADLNAFTIISTDCLKYGPPAEFRERWARALVAGIALALKIWDLILREFCYGDKNIIRMLLRTHPPTDFRVTLIV